jgi:hypothetical protein
MRKQLCPFAQFKSTPGSVTGRDVNPEWKEWNKKNKAAIRREKTVQKQATAAKNKAKKAMEKERRDNLIAKKHPRGKGVAQVKEDEEDQVEEDQVEEEEEKKDSSEEEHCDFVDLVEDDAQQP